MQNQGFVSAWKTAFQNKRFTALFIISWICVFIIMPGFSVFLNAIESRVGYIFIDPIFGTLPGFELAIPTFTILYPAMLLGMIYCAKRPNEWVKFIFSYLLLISFRWFAIFLMPLSPPPAMVILRDPFVEFFAAGNILTKDLFFSGHTSTLFLMFLTVKGKYFKPYLFISTLIIATCVLLQKAHYSVDVYAAPFYAYGAYSIVHKIYSYFEKSKK